MRILAWAIVFMISCVGLAIGGEAPDSGIYGVVPNYQGDLTMVQNQLKYERDHAFVFGYKLNDDKLETIIEDWKSRCVEAYYADSALPNGYSLLKHQGQLGAITLFGPCYEPVEFPRGYMRVAAATSCNTDGSFHLPLKPGKYEVFVGREERFRFDEHAPGETPWHQIVSLKANQWRELLGPESPHLCQKDSDCENGYLCTGQVLRAFKKPASSCEPILDAQGPFTSGIRGRVGVPRKYCIGASYVPLYPEHQCIEAFMEDKNEMAACAACLDSDDSFAMPLEPGKYTLKYPNAYYDPSQQSEEREIEIKPGEWDDLYLKGATPGPVKSPCWGGWVE